MAKPQVNTCSTRTLLDETEENSTETPAQVSRMAKVPNLPGPLVDTDDWGGLSLPELTAQDWTGDGDMRWHTTAEAAQHDNTRRAGWALAALARYAHVCHHSNKDSLIGDLLTDLRHLCDALGTDIDTAINRSQIHHDDEIGRQR